MENEGNGRVFDIGYVCGVLCSCGSVVWDEENGNYSLRLETKDREFCLVFQEKLENVVNKKVHLYCKKSPGEPGGCKTYVVQFYGKKEIEWLAGKWNLAGGAWAWQVPQAAFENRVFRKGFLRGFFDGGGSVKARIVERKGVREKRRAIRAYSVNAEGLKQVRRLLELEKIKAMMYKSGRCYCIDIEGKMKAEIFNRNVGFGVTQKRQKLEEALVPLSAGGRE
jgi:DNA-binding transcriptional regulator WhiA